MVMLLYFFKRERIRATIHCFLIRQKLRIDSAKGAAIFRDLWTLTWFSPLWPGQRLIGHHLVYHAPFACH